MYPQTPLGDSALPYPLPQKGGDSRTRRRLCAIKVGIGWAGRLSTDGYRGEGTGDVTIEGTGVRGTAEGTP